MRTKNYAAMAAALTTLLIAILACNRPQPVSTPALDLIVAQTQTAIAVAEMLTPASTVTATPEPTPTLPQPAATNTAVPQDANCTDRAQYVSETIPDNTEFAPGAQFIKTWTFKNIGTCTWTPEYKLVFIEGNSMGGTSPAPIGQNVPPGGTIQIHLPQTAPAEPGEHQGFWKLQNLRGQNFGLGSDANTAFWVKIKVSPSAPSSGGGLNLGAPTRSFSFDDKKGTPFFLGEDEDISFDIENSELILTAFRPAGDLWRVAELGQFRNLALEVTFRTGNRCAGRDSYGVIVRAPSQPDNIIDSAYVFSFNCDGQYRVYRMDNGNYTGIQNWTANSNLRPGPGQKNIMTVKAQDDLLQLYANGALVFEFTDATHSRGLIGLLIGSGGTQNFQVAVEQLAYWELP